MIVKKTVEEAFNMESTVYVDVRTPLEFADGCIPGAINIPILNNDERAFVGLTFKNNSPEEAKVLGVKYAATKLPIIYEEILSLTKQYKNVIIYCWRGGMRSGSVASFLNSLGLTVYQLEGGYKAYRKRVIDYFENGIKTHDFIVLHGFTGVGKTEILERLELLNVPILNLELLIKNSGSVFGTVGFQNQKPVPQKMFEAQVFEILRSYDQRFVVVESEGQRLGGVILPEGLFRPIVNGKHILLSSSIEARVDRLVNDYVNKVSNCDILLEQAISSLKKRIGLDKVNQCISWINEKNYHEIARMLIIEYYDPLYSHSIKDYIYAYQIDSNEIDDVLKKVVNIYNVLEES